MLGYFQLQAASYKSFVPLPFPPSPPFTFSSHIAIRHSEATRLLGKLDGISQLLHDKDFFTYVCP